MSEIDLAFIKRCAAQSLEARGFLFADGQNKRLGHVESQAIPPEALKETVYKKGALYYINPAYVLKLKDAQISALFQRILKFGGKP